MNGRTPEFPSGNNSNTSSSATALDPEAAPDSSAPVAEEPRDPGGSPELHRALAEVKGQAQFLLYLADQIEESLSQFAEENDSAHSAFLCKILSMYSGQLEVKYHSLGERVAETCQEVYLTVRERDAG